jgi:hypothetical protein
MFAPESEIRPALVPGRLLQETFTINQGISSNIQGVLINMKANFAMQIPHRKGSEFRQFKQHSST